MYLFHSLEILRLCFLKFGDGYPDRVFPFRFRDSRLLLALRLFPIRVQLLFLSPLLLPFHLRVPQAEVVGSDLMGQAKFFQTTVDRFLVAAPSF